MSNLLTFEILFYPYFVLAILLLIEKCKYQWFHYVCVALDVIPDGDWYCPECAGRQILAHAFSVSLGRRAGTVNRERGGWENTTQF